VLLVCLTLLRGMDHLRASGVNLLFFLPTGGLSLWLHHRHGLVRWRLALPALLAGGAGVLLGSWGAGLLPQLLLSRLFGALLLGLAARQLWGLKKSG